ncbi:MAG: AIR synthase-related protein, partial [Candidatus Omnitrophica bacterium]|nr:AIR synthase-related protein [Candidatus Omnitrophota bacterium]
FDPLYLANEGTAVIIVAAGETAGIIRALRKHPLGRSAAVVGKVTASPRETVVLETSFGTQRIVEMLESELLPRIC